MTQRGQPPAPRERHLPPSQRPSAAGPLDAIDKILDKGIVIDAWVEARLLGIPLLSLEARVVVASIETYLWYAQSIMELPPIGRGPLAGPRAMGRAAGLAFETAGEQGLLSQPAETPEPAQAMAEQAMAELPPDQFNEQAQALLERAQRIEERERALAEREAALQTPPDEPAEPEPAPEAAPVRANRRGGTNA